jgi:hypothetical protein
MYIETILFVLEKNNNTCIKLPVSKDGDMSGSFLTPAIFVDVLQF